MTTQKRTKPDDWCFKEHKSNADCSYSFEAFPLEYSKEFQSCRNMESSIKFPVGGHSTSNIKKVILSILVDKVFSRKGLFWNIWKVCLAVKLQCALNELRCKEINVRWDKTIQLFIRVLAKCQLTPQSFLFTSTSVVNHFTIAVEQYWDTKFIQYFNTHASRGKIYLGYVYTQIYLLKASRD